MCACLLHVFPIPKCVTVCQNNTLVSTDNKGMAAHLYESGHLVNASSDSRLTVIQAMLNQMQCLGTGHSLLVLLKVIIYSRPLSSIHPISANVGDTTPNT
jgi:hypothetical protein